MTFVDNFLAICEARGETPSHALQAAGLSKSFLTQLKRHPDRMPYGNSVEKIARYFGCSMEDLLYDHPVYERTQTAIKIQRIVDRLSHDQQEYLLQFILFNWGDLK